MYKQTHNYDWSTRACLISRPDKRSLMVCSLVCLHAFFQLQIRKFHIINDFEQFFTFFTISTLIFLKNNKVWNIQTSYCASFFVSGVFQNFEVNFWPLLKAEKVRPPNRIWRKNLFLQNFIFYHPYERCKLLASRITQNSVHCYTLSYIWLVTKKRETIKQFLYQTKLRGNRYSRLLLRT